jgi:hypothetical protein
MVKSTNYEAALMKMRSLSLLGTNIIFSTNTLDPCSSLRVRDQLSHPCKVTGKIKVLCILIFMVLYRRRDYTGFNILEFKFRPTVKTASCAVSTTSALSIHTVMNLRVP